ncbi:YitT family protein [Hydrogenoanaerobacterium sp.]|uniref:YitT family protein n=1 Tax=Hydrogenoanaerobacterium sp. TaxID=2953763 RepID=UPI00289BF21D|nr:YitT family protein [Hydrogenoanaerobacterium sp.]
MNQAKLKDFGTLNLGVLIVAAGVYFFKFPNNFSIGGVSGISVILGSMLKDFSPGTLVFILNMVLMLLGFAVFGKGFGLKTAYASFMLSAEIWVFERLFPMSHPFTDEPVLELVFAVMLPAIGSAILFNIDASTGGTDVIAMILKKYSNVNIGRALLLSDFLITIAAGAVFGVKTGLFSILGLAAKALVVDSVIESINLCKYFTIITSRPDEVINFIVKNLHRGATSMDANGVFTHENKTVILCAVHRAQAVQLRNYIRSVDAKAFILITNTSEIIGKGFRGVA